MLKQLPIKKEYLFVTTAVIVVLICYQLAFRKTIEALQLNNRLKNQLTQAVGLSYQPAYLERKNKNLDQILRLYKTDTVAFRNNIISSIASIAEKENVKLSEVPVQDPIYRTDKFIIQKLDFEGDFFALTTVFNNLQSTMNIGVIRSAIYKVTTVRSGVDNNKKLILEIFLETAK